MLFLTLDDRRGLLIVISLFLSVCITPIELKFGGQVFYGVQTDSFKFGVICVKTKARREFFLFLIGLLQ